MFDSRNFAIKDIKVYENGELRTAAAVIRGGHIEVADEISDSSLPLLALNDAILLPGFADVHVHLREPGFSYKETIRTGTAAAAAGGYTAVCSMPNLNPVPDSAENLRAQLEIIKKDALIRVCPYGAITVGQKGETLAALEELAPNAIAFSDDGKGVQSEDMMREAMLRAKALGKMIVAHCEDESLLRGGCIHDGEYARAHSIPGICSESEWGPIERDLKLVEETGCAYHVCHISTKESVALIREAKAKGLDVSCETAPHYLVFCDNELQDSGRFRMNPPIRSAEDRDALIEGILDGTIDMIATDHAPHSEEEKSRGLRGSLNGIIGLESAFPVMYTHFVKTGRMSLQRLMELMVYAPRRRFGIALGVGDFALWELGESYIYDPKTTHAGKGTSSPFDGMELYGAHRFTALNGEIVDFKK
ncbi:MAG: dihydroorotase [Oscillospiraceae bacterium]|nr:dihydroorotase [Oscillospiraceae bacterium]